MRTDRTYLTVPIELDALHIDGPSMAAIRRSPDYSRLPWFDADRQTDVNADLAYLAESIVAQPFANADVQLGHGLHLHWAMPDALTRGWHDPTADQIRFPALPNRWLVTRRPSDPATPGDSPTGRTFSWIVESDYVAAVGVNRRGAAVAVPLVAAPAGTKNQPTQPFRYLGRTMPLVAWTGDEPAVDEPPDQYLTSPAFQTPLTAVGFGDPTFAAYYPSCHSVFGLCDSAPSADLSSVRYDLIGWYAERNGQTTDPLEEFLRSTPEDPDAPDPASDWVAAIGHRFDWHVADAAHAGTSDPPTRILCTASMTFDPAVDRDPRERGTRPEPRVTVANSPSEAIAAHVARAAVERLGPNVPDLATPVRARIEQTLGAVQFDGMLDEDSLSLPIVLRAMQHQTRFSPVEGGTTWRVRTDAAADRMPLTDPQSIADQTKRTPLTTEVLDALKLVNDRQRIYDDGRAEIDGLQRRLFGDWYKYMVALYPPDVGPTQYPDPDLIRFFIERADLIPLREALARVGEIAVDEPLDEDGTVIGPPALTAGDPTSAAAQLIDAIEILAQEVSAFEADLAPLERNAINLRLESVPDHRFWEPNEPVVLIAGDLAENTRRHGADGTLPATVYRPSPPPPTTEAALAETQGRLLAGHALIELHDSTNRHPAELGQTVWKEQPWNPVLMEWRVQLLPLRGVADGFAGSDTYDPDFVRDNFEAPILNPELALRPAAGAVRADSNVYVGSSILTGQAGTGLQNSITTRLLTKSTAINRWFEERKITGDPERRAALTSAAQLDDLFDWFNTSGALLDDPTVAMVASLRELLNAPMLSQQLGGFNEALITRQDSVELTVDDPVNFTSYRNFSKEEVREVLRGSPTVAPNPKNAFNPIRAGSLKVLNLKVVDTFGQARKIDPQQVIAPADMAVTGSNHLIQLPPRIVQPARLDFRWLSATSDNELASAATGASPICGWVVPNMLDRSLWFYDAEGAAVGYYKTGQWRPSPDTDSSLEIADIPNPHLRRVIQFLEDSIVKVDRRFDETFVAVIEDALENIVTRSHRPPRGSAALIGRPVAIVRARLDLETHGLPAVSNTWAAFSRDLQRSTRTTGEFTKVQFPVRLGEYGQLGDGLVGYWLEDWDQSGELAFGRARGDAPNAAPAVFYSPQSDFIDNAALETRFDAVNDGAINFHQTIDDPPQFVTMLIDPHGSVHATVGILPRQELRVPPELFAKVLDNIEIGFLHAPIITPVGRKELPLGGANGFAWTWVEEQNDQWQEFHPDKRVTASSVIRAWEDVRIQLEEKQSQQPPAESDHAPQSTPGSGTQLWDVLTNPHTGWLAPTSIWTSPRVAGLGITVDIGDEPPELSVAASTPEPEQEHRIVGAEDRPSLELPPPFAGHEALIEDVLDAVGIGLDPPVTHAVFGRPNEIRDGWLKLRRDRPNPPHAHMANTAAPTIPPTP